MKRFIILATALIFSYSTTTFAEGKADRRHDNNQHDMSHVIAHIHATHGATAAGHSTAKGGHAMHDDMMAHTPRYTGQRHAHRYHGLTAAQYKRSSVGSN